MNYIGEFSALLTAFLWSGTSLAFSSAAKKIGPFQLNIDRMILASAFLITTILIMGYSIQLTRLQYFYLVLSGVIGLIFGDSFLFKSFQLIGARISMLLMALSPGMSAILAFVFLDERITPLGLLGITITISGIALVVLEKGSDSKFKISGLGILYGLLGAMGQAGGLIFAKFAFEEGHIAGFVATFIRIISSVIILLPVLLILKRYKNPYKIFYENKSAFGATLIGTILGPFLGITFSLIAIENTKVGIAATLMSTMPIIMLPMLKYIYKEKLSWRSTTGAIVAVIGVALIFLR